MNVSWKQHSNKIWSSHLALKEILSRFFHVVLWRYFFALYFENHVEKRFFFHFIPEYCGEDFYIACVIWHNDAKTPVCRANFKIMRIIFIFRNICCFSSKWLHLTLYMLLQKLFFGALVIKNNVRTTRARNGLSCTLAARWRI